MYRDTSTGEIAERLNRTCGSIYNQSYLLGLKKSNEFLSKTSTAPVNGLSARFKKGDTPHNKGAKMSSEIKHTFFQDGHLPHNTRNDGDISIRRDKSGRVYKYIRISLAKWQPLHRVIWEQHNNPLLKSEIVTFKDGNSLNCAIENLEVISRSQNMDRNTIHNYPEEIKATIRTLSKLKKSIRKHEEQN